MSSSSLAQDRMTVSGVINSDTIGLKTFLFDFFSSTRLGAIIGPREKPHETPIQLEGPTSLVTRALNVLQAEFQDKFPGVECKWDEQHASTDSTILDKVTIVETPFPLKRSTSSGELKENKLEDISVG